MSLAIDVDNVTEVLLPDGWHVVYNATFHIDAYEFVDGHTALLGGGEEPLVPATGFAFVEKQGGPWVTGPITSVLAVRNR